MAMLLVLVLLLVLLVWGAGRARELFRIDIVDGHLRVVRGHAPTALLNDFGPVVRGVKRGTIIATKTQDSAHISCSGEVDEGTAQRLRNIFGLYPIAKLR